MREKGSPVTNRGVKRPPWPIVALVVLLAGLAVSCGGAAGSGGTPASDESGSARAGAEQAQTPLGAPSLGEEDAPVVVTEYSDYQ